MKAYLRYAANLKLACQLVYESQSAWSVKIEGHGCWDAFHKESGKHVVQRIPPTEAKGRRHTSAISVAVLPLVKNADSHLDLNDVELITQRGHGRGGQNQNKVESAVRAIHRPTGVNVFINGRDQYQNKQLALEILASRLAEIERCEIQNQRQKAKFDQVGLGGRSGKIRTYNFINSYVLDHRTGMKTHRIQEVMRGRFDLI